MKRRKKKMVALYRPVGMPMEEPTSSATGLPSS